MSRPLIALITDFGTADHYVGTMKGVALGICPEATLVDVTHDVAPHDVAAGALALAACHRYFPPHTVFLVVVDPGVGSARRGLAVRRGPTRFVAPDNGVLTPVLTLRAQDQVVELRNAQYALAPVSRTFEGRDRFAPAAAWLAGGLAIDALGPPVADPVRLSLADPRESGGVLEGQVVAVDRFGNLVTNLTAAALDAFAGGGAVTVAVGSLTLERLVATYADVPAGRPCALIGSSGTLEIACNGDAAAARFGLARGATVRVSRAR